MNHMEKHESYKKDCEKLKSMIDEALMSDWKSHQHSEMIASWIEIYKYMWDEIKRMESAPHANAPMRGGSASDI